MNLYRLTSTRRRILGTGIGLAVCALILVVGLTYRWFLNPDATPPERADSIIVLGGGDGERLPTALNLMKSGVAGTILISRGGGTVDEPTWTEPEHVVEAVNSLCAEAETSFEVICRFVKPDSTQGEALLFSQIAKEKGWRKLVIVTSDYHLFRSVRWFERCFDGEVFGAPAPSRKTADLVTHEWLGVIAQTVLPYSCEIAGN